MKIELVGIEKLQVKLKKSVDLKLAKEVVKKNGAELQKEIVKNANFKGHYEGSKFVPPTGTTKRSVTLDFKDNGLTADVGPTTEYSGYVEYGTRFMEAQPFVRPSFDKQKEIFIDDMKKITK